MLGPNTAFVVAIFGILAVYCELIWPGKIFSGLAGAALLLTSGYFLWKIGVTVVGLELLAAAGVLFLVEIAAQTYFVVSGLATVALTAGALKLMAAPNRIVPGLAIPLCIVFGAVTVFLTSGARRARQNKRSDLG